MSTELKYDPHCDCGICAYCNGQEDAYGNPSAPALLQQPTGERCGECGRTRWAADTPKGHRCVFPATEAPTLTATEFDELRELQKQYELSGLGDRPHSMAASKLQRLMDLEGKARNAKRATTDVAIERSGGGGNLIDRTELLLKIQQGMTQCEQQATGETARKRYFEHLHEAGRQFYELVETFPCAVEGQVATAGAGEGTGRQPIDVSERHDFIQIKGSDRCGLRGCVLGVLEHAWIPPWPATVAEGESQPGHDALTAEIREVLNWLRTAPDCWCEQETRARLGKHMEICERARALYSKLNL